MNNLVVVNGGRDTWALWNILIFVKIQTDELFWTLWVNPVTHWTPRSHTLNCCGHHAPAFHLNDHPLDVPYLSISLSRDTSLAGHKRSFTDWNGWQKPFGMRWYILAWCYYLLGFQGVASMWWVARVGFRTRATQALHLAIANLRPEPNTSCGC